MNITGKIYQNSKNNQFSITLKKKELDSDFLEKKPKFITIEKYKVR